MQCLEPRRGWILAAGATMALALPSAASASVVSLWHMDETSGTTMRDSVGPNNGTLKNVALGQPGFLNRAFGFNGSSSIVTVPNNASLIPGAADFTVTVHVKFSAVPSTSIGDYDLARRGLSSSTGGDWKVEILPRDSGTTAKASCHASGSAGSRTNTNGPNLANNAWHTITCMKRASSLTLQVDGVSYPKSATIGSITNASRLTLGAKSTGDWYGGLMDEVSFSKP
jgi:Concanavalin A-like lectin/glucanases superfamily